MSRPVLLDSSYLIDLERERRLATSARRGGSCRRSVGARWSSRSSPWEELLEGAIDESAALASLQRFAIQRLHLADVLGADRAAFERLGARYLRAR